MGSVAEDWIVNPIAFEIFGLPIRWYALAYLAGFILGWRYALLLARTGLAKPTDEDMDEFLTWAVIGTILGGIAGFFGGRADLIILRHSDERLLAHDLGGRKRRQPIAMWGAFIGVTLLLLVLLFVPIVRH